MSAIPSFISFLLTSLVDLLTSELLWPFVGVWVAGYVVYVFLSFFKRRY